MKSTVLAVSLASILTSFGVSAAGQGAGVVNFHGYVIDAPCSIAPESKDQTIEFGDITKSFLQNGGKSEQKLTIKLINCDAATAAKGVQVNFGGAVVGGTSTELLTAGTTNTAIKLNGYGEDVVFGTPTKAVMVADGDTFLEYTASLVKASGATVAEGEFTAVSNFTMTYP
ncbi:fimbrial protein [Enterobacter bugandensis]|uniref:fimbrial protein n=1 Tax=Enterobacter TaxID=547 RepID=UPI00124A27BD|nr:MULTISPECIES: fimbrial protein [Enterobacter]MCP1116410.1 type 1 fimbrial protein [Enterobacter bugandensis]MDO2434279.1 fimbrial protein [Enterobacter bugandensis]MDO2447368.1 fimbrial protein [Enterobacter bugandensis]HBU6133634.1 type 1 fimbrial protein [Enterobacter cloacae]